MQIRLLTIFGVIVSVLLVIILAFVINLSLAGAVQAQPTGPVAGPQITVVGRGEVNATPDTAYVQIGVETEAETTQEALAQNNTQSEAIIAKLTELGVAETDIQTSNFSIYARYNDNGSRIRGYNVSNMVSVKIRNLDEAGALLDEVVQVGANRVYGISFGVDDPSDLLAQARDTAVADARARAERLAQASGGSLGQVLVITENVGAAPPPVALARGAIEEAADAAVPIQTGEQTYSAQIQVTYELR